MHVAMDFFCQQSCVGCVVYNNNIRQAAFLAFIELKTQLQYDIFFLNYFFIYNKYLRKNNHTLYKRYIHARYTIIIF